MRNTMKRITALLTLLTLWNITAWGATVAFTAEAPAAVISGEQFQIQYILNDTGKDFRAPSFEGFEVLYGPSVSVSTSMQFSTSSGRSTQTISTYTMVLMAQKEGTYQIEPATVKCDNRQYTSNALTLKVLPPDKTIDAATANTNASENGNAAAKTQQGTSSDDLFLRMHLSKTKVYEQEAIVATLKLYSRVNVVNAMNANFSDFSGFTVQALDLPNNLRSTMENYKGVNYSTTIMRQWVLFPQRSGKIEIGKSSMELVIQVPSRRQMRSIFDMMDAYDEVRKTVSSQPLSIEVSELPFGKPSSFSGGVGEFSVASSISKNSVKANEAITLTFEISGNGNIRYVKNPEIKFPDDFEVYDPKIDLSTEANAQGVSGKKTIEYTLIPRFAGDFTIPATTFSYFDLKSKSYKSVETPPYHLTVEKGAEGESSTVVNNFTQQEQLKQLGEDIRFIQLKGGKLVKDPHFYYGTLGYWLFYGVPVLLFLILVLMYRKQAKANANVDLMRTKKANKMAKKRLRLAGKYLKEHNKEFFYDEVLKAVWGYLSDKLNIPVSDLTKEKIAEALQERGVESTLISSLLNVLDTCEFARYAPGDSDEDRNHLYDEAVAVIESIEDSVK